MIVSPSTLYRNFAVYQRGVDVDNYTSSTIHRGLPTLYLSAIASRAHARVHALRPSRRTDIFRAR